MADALAWLFDESGFTAHGFCLAWKPGVLLAHISADAAISVSYLSVSVTLLAFAHLRRDLVFRWIFQMIAVVFAFCGLSHFSDLLTIWFPLYDLQAVLKVVAGLSSVATAAGLWWLLPRALALPSPAALRTANERLEEEVGERREAERQAQAALEAAERASRTKSEFLAMVSHELRTPLTAILGFSDQLRHGASEELGERQKKYVDIIVNNGNHLLNLINEVLDFSRLEFGRFDLQIEPLSLEAVAEDSVASVISIAEAKSISLTIDIAPDLPAIEADAQRLRQVFINLLSNAVKFTPAGGAIAVTARATEAGEVAVAVSDTGIGMSAEEIPLALEKFRQVDNSLARPYEGIGLGLPLVQEIVALHGGRLTIDSEPGKGTIVTAFLPLRRAVAAV